MAQQFWDEKWREHRPVTIDTTKFRDEAEPSERGFLDLVGDVDGKKILELGCGTGLFTVYFATMGAIVTAIDNSSEAVRTTSLLATHNEVDGRVNAIELDANDLPSLGNRFDLVVGRFILHHIEPFERFAPMLSELLAEDGRGVFLENNARNPVLMFVRRFLIGRFGLPKYGDENEKPFDIGEIGCLHKRFSRVELTYPEMMCFQLAASYVFRSNRFAFSVLKGLDSWIYRHLPVLNRYSYRQLIEVRR